VVEAYAPLVRWRTRGDGNSEWADYTEGDWHVHVMDQDGDLSVWSIDYRGKEVINCYGITTCGTPAYDFEVAKIAAIAALREAQRALREQQATNPCRHCEQSKESCDAWRIAPRIAKACCNKCDHSPEPTEPTA